MVNVILDSSKDGISAILGYLRDCKYGLRMVGSCCHVMAFISYLSHYRLKEDITEIAAGIKRTCFPNHFT